MFHEFGHGLSSLFNAAPYPRLAGNMPRDFTEVPSQFNEHWALDPEVFAHYARHYRTGAPMPAALVAKIRRTTTFDQGFATTEYLGAALLDMAWHTLTVDDHPTDVDSFETQALHRYGVDLAVVPPRYRTNYFSHIWGGGYSAGYYDVHLGRGDRRRRVRLVPGARRADAGERPALPRHDPLARRDRRHGGDLPRLPGAGPRDRAAAGEPGADRDRALAASSRRRRRKPRPSWTCRGFRCLTR